jgi:hypothetical protein
MTKTHRVSFGVEVTLSFRHSISMIAFDAKDFLRIVEKHTVEGRPHIWSNDLAAASASDPRLSRYTSTNGSNGDSGHCDANVAACAASTVATARSFSAVEENPLYVQRVAPVVLVRGSVFWRVGSVIPAQPHGAVEA